MGNKIDELQADLREAARRVCRPEEILGAISLINYLGKACFIQGLSNELIQTIVRSRGSGSPCPRLLNCRKKNAQFFQRRGGHPQQLMGPP